MDKSIAICIPTMGLVHWRFAADLAGLQLISDTSMFWQPRTMINNARNLLVKRALDNVTTSHVLFLDDDMTFRPDFLMRLASHNEDIVGGLAFKRTPDFQPCVYMKKEDGNHYPILPTEFQEVDAIGTGGVLIRRQVFEKLRYPWFETWYDKDDDNRLYSVDFDFCIKARKAGIKIHVDPAAEMGHIGEAPIITKEIFLKNASEKYGGDTQHKS